LVFLNLGFCSNFFSPEAAYLDFFGLHTQQVWRIKVPLRGPGRSGDEVLRSRRSFT